MTDDTIAFLEQVAGGPAYVLGHSDGAVVALLTALRRPDLVRRLVFSSGVFHHSGWAPGAIDLDRTHRSEPELTVADLAGYPGPSLVTVGDGDDEIPKEHTIALYKGLPRAARHRARHRATACWPTSRTCATAPSSTSWRNRDRP
jgi:pimeloyl-ACP methyl ester carboxylesterase